jgi:hypothetical protein
MAIQIEENISLFKGEHLFTLGIEVDDPKDTLDTLSLERLVSLEDFVSKFQERRVKDIDQQEVEEKDLDKGYQSHGEEQEFTHASSKETEDLDEEREPKDIKHDDEVLMCAPPSNEAIPNPFPPTQEEEDEVNHFPFQVFDDTLFYDSEGEEEREPLDEIDPPYYEAVLKMLCFVIWKVKKC